MYPEILHISFFHLHTYGVLVALAFLSGLWMAARFAKRAALNVDAVTNLGIYCALAAIVGAKVMMIIVRNSSGTVRSIAFDAKPAPISRKPRAIMRRTGNLLVTEVIGSSQSTTSSPLNEINTPYKLGANPLFVITMLKVENVCTNTSAATRAEHSSRRK